jgi:hypothetical protein
MFGITTTIDTWLRQIGALRPGPGTDTERGMAVILNLWNHTFVTTLSYEPGRAIALGAYEYLVSTGQLSAGAEGQVVFYYYYQQWTGGAQLPAGIQSAFDRAQRGGADPAPAMTATAPASQTITLPQPGPDPVSTAVAAAMDLIRRGIAFDPKVIVAFYFNAPGWDTSLYLKNLADAITREGIALAPGQPSPFVLSIGATGAPTEVTAAQYFAAVTSAGASPGGAPPPDSSVPPVVQSGLGLRVPSGPVLRASVETLETATQPGGTQPALAGSANGAGPDSMDLGSQIATGLVVAVVLAVVFGALK